MMLASLPVPVDAVEDLADLSVVPAPTTWPNGSNVR